MKHLTFAFCFLLPIIINAENPLTQQGEHNETEYSATRIVSIVPQYALISGLRVDYDIKRNQNRWIQLGPVVFAGRTPLFNRSIDQITGVGLSLYHRYYPGKGYGYVPVYLAFGPTYQFTHLKYETFTGTTMQNSYSQIHKAGFDITVGVCVGPKDLLIFDFYMGMGIRHSFLSSNATKPKIFDSSYFDYGYSGNILIIGIRAGLPIKK